MSRINYGLITILLFFTLACETDPVIYVYQPPMPVIYGIFNSSDNIHYLKIGKSFGAENDPRVSAGVYDSLYFKNIEENVQITVGGKSCKLQLVEDIPKDAGLFHSPDQKIYCFQTDPGRWSKIHVQVEIPGLPVATGQVFPVSVGRITTPKKAQQYIFLVPNNPLRVIWDGNPWNEIDVSFEFIEDMGDSVFQSKWVHIQNTNYFDSPHDQYRELTITYDEFIQEVLLQIQPNDSVEQIFFGNISITIFGGDNNMVQYMKYLNGYNDFNVQGFSNIENGLGVLASRASFTRDSLHFDYETRKALMNENRLKVLKISPWN